MGVEKALLVLVLHITVLFAKRTFHGDQVLTLLPTSEDHVALIQNLENGNIPVDFWSPKYANGVKHHQEIDVRIPSDYLDTFKDLLSRHGIEHTVKIENVQRLINGQFDAKPSPAASKSTHDYDYDRYHTLDEIVDWTASIADEYGGIVRRDIIGQSYEGRDIWMLTLETDASNPALLIDCGFHSREWISTAFCQCLTRNILENYGTVPYFTNLLNKLTIHIIPVANADGYIYTWAEDRLWRKTRSVYADNICVGTDPNRNWDVYWSGPGASNFSCAINYYGPAPESESEVKAVADFMRANIGRIVNYISVHSYTQLLMYPYFYEPVVTDNHEELTKYAKDAVEAIESVYGTNYIYGAGGSLLYISSGSSADFAYEAGIPLVFAFELRDQGEFGFLLPESQIKPTCVETTAGFMQLADATLQFVSNRQ